MKKYNRGIVLSIFFGLMLPSIVYGATVSLSRADIVKFMGETSGDQMGFSVSGVGDVNGDGYDDIVVGANKSSTGIFEKGAAYLVYGSAAGMTAESLTTAVKFSGEGTDDEAGHAIAGAGDINNDGYDDIIVGAYKNNNGAGSDAGAAYVVYGKADKYSGVESIGTAAGAKFIGETAGDKAGFSVSGAGDLNNDGYDDIIVGAYTSNTGGSDAGAAYVVYGKADKYSGVESIGTAAGAKFIGEAAGDYVGSSVSGAGDINSDGYDDIVISAIGNTSGAGAAYIVYGKADKYSGVESIGAAPAAKFTGEAAGDSAGSSVSGAGDMNKDGYDDIVIGAFISDTGGSDAGAAYVIYGKADKYVSSASLSTTPKFTGESIGENLGNAVSGAGDINSDGYDDIVIGAYASDAVATDSGAAYIVYGKADKYSGVLSIGTAAGSKFTGEAASDAAGFSVSGAGDVNGDGYVDMLISAAGQSSDTGAVYVLMPKPSQLQLVTANTDENNVFSCDEEYEEKGATAVDPVTNSALAVTVSGDVLETPGTYKKTYTVASNSWNIVTVEERNVVVPDCTPTLKTNGKYLQVIVNDEIVDTKKIGKKKISKKYYKLVQKKLYKKKSYSTVAVLRSGKKKASVIVFRLTEDNTLTKKVKKSVELAGKRTPLKLKLNTKKKQVSISIGKGQSKIEALYKLTKKGKLKEIQ